VEDWLGVRFHSFLLLSCFALFCLGWLLTRGGEVEDMLDGIGFHSILLLLLLLLLLDSFFALSGF